MTVLIVLIPVSLGLGLAGLLTFRWALKKGQFEDLGGDQHRALFGGHDDHPAP